MTGNWTLVITEFSFIFWVILAIYFRYSEWGSMLAEWRHLMPKTGIFISTYIWLYILSASHSIYKLIIVFNDNSEPESNKNTKDEHKKESASRIGLYEELTFIGLTFLFTGILIITLIPFLNWS
jgi:hypothetical protein